MSKPHVIIYLLRPIIIPTGVPCITDCVVGELEKLGSKFRVAQQIAKDARFERLPCMHKGTYADDCLVNRVTQVCTTTVLL